MYREEILVKSHFLRFWPIDFDLDGILNFFMHILRSETNIYGNQLFSFRLSHVA